MAEVGTVLDVPFAVGVLEAVGAGSGSGLLLFKLGSWDRLDWQPTNDITQKHKPNRTANVRTDPCRDPCSMGNTSGEPTTAADPSAAMLEYPSGTHASSDIVRGLIGPQVLALPALDCPERLAELGPVPLLHAARRHPGLACYPTPVAAGTLGPAGSIGAHATDSVGWATSCPRSRFGSHLTW
ncbi:MAG: hypothetical protein ACRCZF_25030 [Gemmataceae bacterium]